MNIKLLPLTVAALLLSACINDDDSGPNKELNGSVFTHHDLGLSLQVPETWTNTVGEVIQGQSTELASRNQPENNFAANIVVLQSNHSGPNTMSEILPLYMAAVTAQLPGISFLSDTVYTIQGVEVGRVVYSGTVSGINNALKFKELLFIRGNKDVQIVFTDLEATFDSRTEFDEVENSLSFSGKSGG